MQPRRHETTKKTTYLFRVFVFSWLPFVLIASSEIQLPRAASNDYVGAEACASCHRQVHDTWTSGRHSKMLQPATPAAVKGDFSQGRLTLHGSSFGLRVRNGEFFISESDLTGKEQEHKVEFTLGSRRIQHYLTTIDKGRIVVLAPSWDVERRQWFHNVEIIRPDEDDRQIVQQWNKNCVGCHVSRQDNHYDPRTRSYRTQWMDFGTSCERCHGPGRAHAEQYGRTTPKPGDPSASAGGLIVRPTRLDPNTGSMVCAQCHSLRTVVNPDYRPGDNYYDYFMPVLEYVPVARHASQDPPYWADGRPRRFSNDAIGLWQSACFLRGGATCTTCHTNPHLPDIDRNPQLASHAGGPERPALQPADARVQFDVARPFQGREPASNALCTKCHQDIGTALTAHTRHAAGSAGSACVECHMPKTVASIKAQMRDHTIEVPAPENTVRFKIPNACTECHRDKPPSWAVEALNSWWPNGRRARLVAQAEAFTAARAGRADAIEALIAIGEDGTRPPVVRANAMGYLGRYAEPRAVAALVRATEAKDAVVRGTAVAALREAGRGNGTARDAVLARFDDPQRTVRIGSLLAMINLGGTDVTASELDRIRRVGEEFRAWAAMNQNDAELQHAEGIIGLLGDDFDRAADALSISFDLDPDAPSVRFLFGVARLGQRRVADARSLFRTVPPTDPLYQKAQEQLKKLP
jgi:HEAT repeats/Cytochrome c552/Cytochrome c554 and c-prime